MGEQANVKQEICFAYNEEKSKKKRCQVCHGCNTTGASGWKVYNKPSSTPTAEPTPTPTQEPTPTPPMESTPIPTPTGEPPGTDGTSWEPFAYDNEECLDNYNGSEVQDPTECEVEAKSKKEQCFAYKVSHTGGLCKVCKGCSRTGNSGWKVYQVDIQCKFPYSNDDEIKVANSQECQEQANVK